MASSIQPDRNAPDSQLEVLDTHVVNGIDQEGHQRVDLDGVLAHGQRHQGRLLIGSDGQVVGLRVAQSTIVGHGDVDRIRTGVSKAGRPANATKLVDCHPGGSGVKRVRQRVTVSIGGLDVIAVGAARGDGLRRR